MVNEAISLPVKDSYYLVKFTWLAASPQTLAFTDWGSAVVHTDGVTYVSEASMKVALPVNDGTLKAAAATVTLPMPNPADPDDLRSRLTETKHQAVQVTITEVIRGESGGETARADIRFQGRVGKTRRNLAGENEQLRISCFSAQTQLDIRSGLQCNHQCINTLGDALCKVILGNFSETGTISAISGREVTVTGLAAQTGRYYDRGSLTVETLKIPIFDWQDSDPTKFILVRQPPAHWAGKAVLATAGCDKTIPT